METKAIPVSVYAESTPNPSTMKFVTHKLLVENNATVEYTDSEETQNSPLAARLFNFPFVTGIFITANFITVTKNNLIDWEDVVMEIREYITEYLKDGKSVFIGEIHENTQQEVKHAAIASEFIPNTDTEKKIVEILEDYVRPAVEQDGGAIHVKNYNSEAGKLTVILRGSCSGCPSSSVTLKAGIQGLFDRMLPEVKEVVAEEL